MNGGNLRAAPDALTPARVGALVGMLDAVAATPPLTPAERIILSRITAAANGRLVTPSNEVLCAAIGASSTSTPVRVLARLEAIGLIQITRFVNGREITILATGASTIHVGSRSPHVARGMAGRACDLPRQRAAPPPVPAPAPSPRVDRDPCFRCGVSDEADLAADAQAAAIAAGLRRIDAAIPAGVAGECAECGERMPRLVGGRCGFCRDGRRPPADRYPDPATIPVPIVAPASQQEVTMPNPPPSDDFRNIGLLARGDLLAAIQQRADERTLSLGKAAASLIADAVAQPLARPDLVLVDLSATPIADLIEELTHRLASAPTPELLAAVKARAEATEQLLAAAIARAEAAEGQLATIRAMLGQAA